MKNRIRTFNLLILGGFLSGIFNLFGCGQKAHSQQAGTIEVLSVSEFETRINETEAPQLIDVRTNEEVAAGTLPGAIQINWNSNSFSVEIESLDKDKPVYLYCRSGGRSGQASKALSKAGFTQIVDLKGGITAWKAAKKQISE
ncbi:MAG: rhodanese-related sulfurtransferase [Limisphaerales bacterium]|jgi:rhodanese-related sulfurtransferase